MIRDELRFEALIIKWIDLNPVLSDKALAYYLLRIAISDTGLTMNSFFNSTHISKKPKPIELKEIENIFKVKNSSTRSSIQKYCLKLKEAGFIIIEPIKGDKGHMENTYIITSTGIIASFAGYCRYAYDECFPLFKKNHPELFIQIIIKLMNKYKDNHTIFKNSYDFINAFAPEQISKVPQLAIKIDTEITKKVQIEIIFYFFETCCKLSLEDESHVLPKNFNSLFLSNLFYKIKQEDFRKLIIYAFKKVYLDAYPTIMEDIYPEISTNVDFLLTKIENLSSIMTPQTRHEVSEKITQILSY